MTLLIYHNPRCSKSRETLKLLRENGVEPTIVEYLKEPPTGAELDSILLRLGKEPMDVVRWKEPRIKELNLSKKDKRSREEWLFLLAQNPQILERPIVVAEKKAALGRPPENVLELLEGAEGKNAGDGS